MKNVIFFLLIFASNVFAASTPIQDLVVGGKPYYDLRSRPTITIVDSAAIASNGSIVCSSTYTIASSITITSPFIAAKGCSLVKSGSGSLTFAGDFSSGLYQVFSGFTSSISGLKYVRPEWFGGGVNATASANSTAFSSAITAIKNYTLGGVNPANWPLGGGEILLSSGTYQFDSTIAMYQGMTLRGSGKSTTILQFTGSSSNAVTLNYHVVSGVELTKSNIIIENLSIDAGGNTNIGIYSDNSYGLEYSRISDINVWNAQIGIKIDGGWNNTFRDIDINSCIVGFVGYVTTTSIGFNENLIQQLTVERFTRTGALIAGHSNSVSNSTFQFDSYTGTDSAPISIPSHSFPVGLEIYGKSTTTHGITPSRTDNTTVRECWFEAISDSSNAVGIYIDNEEYAGGLSLVRTTTIERNRFNSNVDRPIFVNDSYATYIRDNSFIGVQPNLITLNTASVVRTMIDEAYSSLTDYSGGQYVLSTTVGANFHRYNALTVGTEDRGITGVFRVDGTYTPTSAARTGAGFYPAVNANYSFISGMEFRPEISNITGTLGTLYGLVSVPSLTNSAEYLQYFYPHYFAYNINSSHTGTKQSIPTVYIGTPSISGGKPASTDGIYIASQGVSGVAGSTGIRIADQSGSTNSYAIITGVGEVAFGDNVSSSGTGSFSTGIYTFGTITANTIDGTTYTGIDQSEVAGLTTASTPTFAGLNLTGNLVSTGTASFTSGTFTSTGTGGGVVVGDGTTGYIKFGAAIIDKVSGSQARLNTGLLPTTDNSATFLLGSASKRWHTLNLGDGGISSSGSITSSTGLGTAGTTTTNTLIINSGGSSGKATCWKTATTLGYCSDSPGITGSCTCN